MLFSWYWQVFISFFSLTNLIVKNDDIEIKLFKGLKLKSTYVPSHVGKNPKTNKDIIVKDKIKISCKLTDYFKNKLL